MKKYHLSLNRAWAWLQTDPGMLLATMVCLPLGLVLVWRNQHLSAGFKKAFIGIGVVLCLLGISLWASHAGLQDHDQKVSAQSIQYRHKYRKAKANSDLLSDGINAMSVEYSKLKASNHDYHAKMKPYEQLAAVEGKKRRADAVAAKKVSDALAKLPDSYNLSLSDKSSVQAVRKAFNLLSKPQQAMVDESILKDDEVYLVDLAKQAQAAKIAAQKKAQAAKAAAQAKAAEIARGYNTGITYDQLARTPDKFKGKKVKFYGEVAQVMEDDDDDSVEVRLAVNGDYDNMLLCDWSSDDVSSRVLENDTITVSGTSNGLITYESTMGRDITIPSITVDKIDQ